MSNEETIAAKAHIYTEVHWITATTLAWNGFNLTESSFFHGTFLGFLACFVITLIAATCILTRFERYRELDIPNSKDSASSAKTPKSQLRNALAAWKSVPAVFCEFSGSALYFSMVLLSGAGVTVASFGSIRAVLK